MIKQIQIFPQKAFSFVLLKSNAGVQKFLSRHQIWIIDQCISISPPITTMHCGRTKDTVIFGTMYITIYTQDLLMSEPL